MGRIDDLITIARAYGEASGLEPVTVSWRAFGDSKKLAAIEAGADIQLGRFERTLQWFSDNWPKSAEWPSGIARPAEKAAA